MERSPLFRSVSHDTLDALLERARVRTLRRGTAVTRQGIEDDQLNLVVTGWLKRHRLAADGREIVLDLPSPGELLGLIEVIDGRPPCHGATTLSTTDLLVIPGTVVRRAFQDDTAFAVAVARVLVETLRTREHELVQLTTEDARTRVAERLVDLAEAGIDETGALPVQLSQEELASWAGISRESAAKTLHDLRERAIVRTGRRRIVIDDLESLREVAAIGGAGPGALPPRDDGDPLRARRTGERAGFERRLRLEQVVRVSH